MTAQYVLRCGCGHSFKVWTPQEGLAEVKKHATFAHPGRYVSLSISLDGFEASSVLDALGGDGQ